MNLIEELGLKRCQEIVDGAPEGATGINWVECDEYNTYVIVKPEWSEKNKHAYWHNDAMTGTKDGSSWRIYSVVTTCWKD